MPTSPRRPPILVLGASLLLAGCVSAGPGPQPAATAVEPGPVRAACAAGREADANRALAGVKARYGYR